jgi:hypothetical protein
MTTKDGYLELLNERWPADHNATPWEATPDGSWTRWVGVGVNPDIPPPSTKKGLSSEGAVRPRSLELPQHRRTVALANADVADPPSRATARRRSRRAEAATGEASPFPPAPPLPGAVAAENDSPAATGAVVGHPTHNAVETRERSPAEPG